MLATSHKPFAFKILLVNLYFPRFWPCSLPNDSTRPGGRGGYPFQKCFAFRRTFIAEISAAGKQVCRRNSPSFARPDRRVACPYVGRGGYFVEATTSSCWLRT